jgi:hypothetical protein
MQETRANADTRGLTRASGRFRPVTSRERLVDDLGTPRRRSILRLFQRVSAFVRSG